MIVALLIAVGAVAVFLFKYNAAHAQGVEGGLALRQAQTLTVTVVALLQVFYLINCRSLGEPVWEIGLFTNPWVFVGIALLLLLQVAFVHLPVMNLLFASAPLAPSGCLIAALVGFTVLP